MATRYSYFDTPSGVILTALGASGPLLIALGVITAFTPLTIPIVIGVLGGGISLALSGAGLYTRAMGAVTTGNIGLGATVGAILGTLVFPGIGTAIGAALGAALMTITAGVTIGLLKSPEIGAVLTTVGGVGLGALVGTFVFPGVGTAIGAAIGAAIGVGFGMIPAIGSRLANVGRWIKKQFSNEDKTAGEVVSSYYKYYSPDNESNRTLLLQESEPLTYRAYYHDLENEALKSKILENFCNDINQMDDRKVEGFIQNFKDTNPEYKILQIHRRSTSFFPSTGETASIRAFNKICDARRASIGSAEEEWASEERRDRYHL